MVQGIVMIMFLICLVLVAVFFTKMFNQEYSAFINDFTGLKSIQSITGEDKINKFMFLLYVLGLVASILGESKSKGGLFFGFISMMSPFIIAIAPIIISECFASEKESNKVASMIVGYVKKHFAEAHFEYLRKKRNATASEYEELSNVGLLSRVLYSTGFLYLMVGVKPLGTIYILVILVIVRANRNKITMNEKRLQLVLKVLVLIIIVWNGKNETVAISTVLFMSATLLWVMDELGSRYNGTLSVGAVVLLVVAIVILCAVAEFGKVPLSRMLINLLEVLQQWLSLCEETLCIIKGVSI